MDFEARNELNQSYGIAKPTKNELKVAKGYIFNRHVAAGKAEEKAAQKDAQIQNLIAKNVQLLIDKTNSETEKNTCNKDLLRLKFPVLVRTIRDRIQENWDEPSECENCLRFGHATKDCPQKQTTKKSKDPKEENYRRAVRYWEYLVTTYKNEVEIKRLLSELENTYEKRSDLFKKYSFEDYLKEFYRCFAIACDIADSKVHIEEIIERIKSLNVFGQPLDEFMLPLIKAMSYMTDPNAPAVTYYEEYVPKCSSVPTQ